MGKDSAIEWTTHTFNPWWGCIRVSPACAHCYAEALDKRTGGHHWGKGSSRRFFPEKHWQEPLKWNDAATNLGVRHKVFCASMADVFEDHPELPAERTRLFNLIRKTPQLDWLLLTKRPENITQMAWEAGGIEYERLLPNIWPGTTVEDVARKGRIETLRHVPICSSSSRFLSVEPLLEDLGPLDLRGIDWVIVGGESGHGSRPMHPEWALSIRDKCKASGVAFFFKQWGDWKPYREMAEEEAEALYRPLKPGQHPDIDSRECKVATIGVCSHPLPRGGPVDQLFRVGKKRAGRTLEGATHDEYPAPRVYATLLPQTEG